MLKVNSNKGKLDILLNEENLFKAEAKERVVKGRQSSKGFSGKASQARTHHPKTSRFKEDGKAKSTFKPQKKDVSEAKLIKTQSTGKDEASADASYLTKDQLSRILSSLKSADTHIPTADAPSMGLVEIATKETPVPQPSIKDLEERQVLQTSQSRTNENIFDNQEQVNVSIKNSQWKKDLDEQIALKQMLKAKENLQDKEKKFKEYNPWGKPGGGAPVRTQSGNIVTDYKKMHQDLSSKSEVVSPPVGGTRSQTKTTVDSYDTLDTITTTTPVAMRSSFAIGAPGVVKFEAYQSKIDEKKKWLQELEQQIKEKKEREAQEKQQQLHKEAREERWNQTPVISNESPQGAGRAVVISTAATTRESPVNTGAASIALDSSIRAGNYHGRGHGLQSLGEVNRDELERKRLKTLEHQRAIKEQVEEKRRLKQEEKERRQKEEAEKERALMIERERLQRQYQEERKQREEKENEAKRRTEALQLSILQASESAQQEKVAKRIKHLELSGHDVSGLKSPGLGTMPQHTATDTSPRNTESVPSRADHGQWSPRITQHNESPTQTEDMISSMTRQKNASFEAELKQMNLNASLESEWTTSSPVSPARSNSQAKSKTKSPSPGKGAVHRTARSQSERGQRKKQTLKQRNKRQGSVENVKGEQETAAIAWQASEDAFMIPYTRTTSATFHPVPDTPSSRQADDVSFRKDLTAVNRKTHKLPQAALGRHTVKNDKTVEKSSVSPRGRHGMAKQDSKTSAVSRKFEKRDVKSDQAKAQNENPGLYPVQVSPHHLPTARQEMILQQLAALRQGLMMKERELHHSAF